MKRFCYTMMCCLFVLAMTNVSHAQPSWHQWLKEFRQDAIADGIEPSFFDQVFRGMRPNKRVINFDRRQPEKRLTFRKYRRTRADNYRIRLGKKKFKRYNHLLHEVGDQFGVDPCFIVAFWGIESSYGHFMGGFSVIKSLATLAYDARRGDFFRRELLLALHILQEGHVSPEQFKGEWAGASGHPQFLPSSWHKFAVDYNRDGRKDIWNTYGDVFASIANYLLQNGWQSGQPWAIEVRLPREFDKSLLDKTIKKPVGQWRDMGVVPLQGEHYPSDQTMAAIIEPYGGPAFMIFKNFEVIMRYNNSTYYAGTVGYMADSICARRRG